EESDEFFVRYRLELSNFLLVFKEVVRSRVDFIPEVSEDHNSKLILVRFLVSCRRYPMES
ncbi:hypothetical protein PMAYCL1PPCAC_24923, partial [Pristionchus mayeri]